jgi:hypothetical protein
MQTIAARSRITLFARYSVIGSSAATVGGVLAAASQWAWIGRKGASTANPAIL